MSRLVLLPGVNALKGGCGFADRTHERTTLNGFARWLRLRLEPMGGARPSGAHLVLLPGVNALKGGCGFGVIKRMREPH